MHHAHVKRKENPMNCYVPEELYSIPDLRERLDRAAHRNRARAIYGAAAWLWSRAKSLAAQRTHALPGRWIARLG
jgi:hypothetical protein